MNIVTLFAANERLFHESISIKLRDQMKSNVFVLCTWLQWSLRLPSLLERLIRVVRNVFGTEFIIVCYIQRLVNHITTTRRFIAYQQLGSWTICLRYLRRRRWPNR